jgi:hypothetical protein
MEVGELVSAGVVGNSVVHAVIALKELTFSANHPIDQDTTGNFTAPEWVSTRTKQWPVCYTRTKNIKLKAKFEVMAPPTATETVKVKGVAKLGTATLEWTGSVSVSPGSTEVTTAELTSSAALPNEVACYDPATIQWEAEPPGEPAYLAGASANVMYVTLGDPSGTPAYWTLLDISCRAAHGATTAAKLLKDMYVPFTSRTLTRKRDDKGLTYWNPRTTKAMNTQQLLASGDGSGQCGSWAEFLIDMYKCHGETSAQKIIVVVSEPDFIASLSKDATVVAGAAGFLVKNWKFVGAGSKPAPWTHKMYLECQEQPGIPGQRNDDPPPAFYNHFIVYALGEYYDPSYGGGPIANQDDWENGAIDGLFKGSLCGHPKSKNPTTRLVKFFLA